MMDGIIDGHNITKNGIIEVINHVQWEKFRMPFRFLHLPNNAISVMSILLVAANAHAMDSNKGADTAICPEDNLVRIGLVGDVYLGKRLLDKLTSPPPAITFLQKHTDIIVANLEGALTERTQRAFPDQPFHHRMPPSVAPMMKGWGVSAVSLANNHTMDFGPEGLADTQKTLTQHSILFAGAGADQSEAEKPLVIREKGITIHLLSFNVTHPSDAWAGSDSPGVAYPWPERLTKRVEESALSSDFVIVSFHWGQELNRNLREYQPRMAQRALKAGADFIFGHHAHVPQGIEALPDGRVIAYGLGNFLFDSISAEATFGLAAIVNLCKQSSGIAKSTVFVPLFTNNAVTGFATRLMTKAEFQTAAKPYQSEGHFQKHVNFWIPPTTEVGPLTGSP